MFRFGENAEDIGTLIALEQRLNPRKVSRFKYGLGTASLGCGLEIGGRHRQLRSVRIAVVDDFEGWRRAIVSMLEEDPQLEIVCEASDGVEAVQRCRELKPDIVVIDVGLPKLNGLEAAKQIREISPQTKILFLSADHCPELIREALRMGAAGYIQKTHAGRELLVAVRSVAQDEEFVRFTVLPDSATEQTEE